MLEDLNGRVQLGHVVQDAGKSPCADHFGRRVDELCDGDQKSHFVVLGTIADLVQLVKEDVVDNHVDLALLHWQLIYLAP